MKKDNLFITLITAILLFSSFFDTVHAQGVGDAPNANFTDLDGVSHDIYTYLDSGYTVLIDFSHEFCGPCKHWSLGVGHELWEGYGPEGNNSIRMFFFDVLGSSSSDADVLEYTQEWGVECPVINLPEPVLGEYTSNGLPNIWFICPDKSYYIDGGYGYPSSLVSAKHNIELCGGADINNKNVSLIDATKPTSNTLCNSFPLQYRPELVAATTAPSDSLGNGIFMQEYSFEIFINGEYHSTQNINPWADGTVTSEEFVLLDPITVAPNDELAFVVKYPGDNFANDDTAKVIIPTSLSTPISSSNSLNVDNAQYLLRGPDGQNIIDGLETGQMQFDLDVDSCYSIRFYNVTSQANALKDANGLTLVSYQLGDYDLVGQMPWMYFHVSGSVSINKDYNLPKKLLKTDYLDVLGKSYTSENIPNGIYFEVKNYTNGYSEVSKYIKHNP